MKKKTVSEIILTLLFTWILSLTLNVIPMRIVYGQATRLHVDPSRVVDTTLLSGENFSVSVNIENVVDLYSWELELRFGRSLLDTTADLGEEGPFLKSQGTTIFTKENRTRGVRFNCTITDPVSGASGNGTLVTVTFIVLGRGYTALRLTRISLEDSARNPISYSWTDGGFRNVEDMYVEPLMTEKKPDDTFDVDIKVANVTNVYGWDFTLSWQEGLIDYVDAIEGPFLQMGGSTYFAKSNTTSAAHVGCTLLGLVPGVTGSGTLATVSFQVCQNTGNCTLALATKLIGVDTTDWTLYPISHTSQNGYFSTPKIEATVDVDPDALNLWSEGQWITAYIELPEGYDAEDIDASTILLNETIPPVLDPQYDFVTNSSEYLVDQDGDGILERMVKFDRAEVAQWIYSDLDIDYGNVTFMITGELSDGTRFEGTDTIKVLLPGDVNYDGVVDISDLTMIGLAWATTPEDPRWNQCCDINMDGFIGTRDLAICGRNFGKTAV